MAFIWSHQCSPCAICLSKFSPQRTWWKGSALYSTCIFTTWVSPSHDCHSHYRKKMYARCRWWISRSTWRGPFQFWFIPRGQSIIDLVHKSSLYQSHRRIDPVSRLRFFFLVPPINQHHLMLTIYTDLSYPIWQPPPCRSSSTLSFILLTHQLSLTWRSWYQGPMQSATHVHMTWHRWAGSDYKRQAILLWG